MRRDFYIEDEDGMKEDDGLPVEIPIEEFQALEFELTYKNVAKYCEEKYA